MLLCINIETNNRLRDYSTLEDAIASLGDSRQMLRQTWLLHPTNPDMMAVVVELRRHIDANTDRLFVVDVTGHRLDGWLRVDLWNWANTHNN